MARKKKQIIEVNNSQSLQGLMQEVYNDACNQLNDAQRVINEITSSANIEDNDDVAKISKAKTDALKWKDSAIKIKLEVGKLQNDIIKHKGDMSNVDDAVSKASSTTIKASDLSNIRAMIKESKGGE